MSSLRSRIVQLSVLSPSNDVLEEMTNVKLEMNWEVENEEIYLEQRARSNWLRNGDKNTIFFHIFTYSKKRLNRIDCLEDSNG